MEIGVYGVATDETLRPDEMARLVEDAGFDALAFGEHTHIPVRSESRYPLGEMPRDYMRTFDLFIAMHSALMATTRLRVESTIVQLAQRDPITTAKEVASIDFLSGGRLDLVVGHGWNLAEVRNHGVDPGQRYDVVRERMLAMREIWRNDEAEFHGEHVDFDAIYSWPKPAQASGVPMILGGNAPGSEERALAYADGWGVIDGAGVAARVAAFTAANPGMRVHVAGVPAEPATIEEYARAGASRVALDLGPVKAGEAEPVLERLRRAVDLALA
jgi:probable F420-dependent oxidoreductase